MAALPRVPFTIANPKRSIWDFAVLLLLARGSYIYHPTTTYYTRHNHFKVRRNGLKVLVNGRPVDAFGDTGSTDNIVDEKYVRKRKLKMTPSASEMVMADGTKLHSPGYVELDVGFPGENEPSTTIIAKVIKQFPFDLLLSHTFLKSTGTLKEHLRRFTEILFPRLTASLSMNFLSSDVSGSLFNASFNGGIPFDAVLDTGSNCSAVDQDWALNRGLQIYQEEKHRGWVSLPSTGRVPTVGRVYVDMNLPDGRIIPMSLEVLEKAAVPVIIGGDTIFDHGLFTEYPEALLERYEDEAELFHMDYKSSWTAKVVAEARKLYPSNAKNKDVELVIRNGEAQRRWDWNRKHKDGKTASKEEWKREYLRRYRYEMALAADNSSGINVRLILEEPLEEA